jgi:hypothetical protein
MMCNCGRILYEGPCPDCGRKKLKVASNEARRRFHEDKARYLNPDDPRETITIRLKGKDGGCDITFSADDICISAGFACYYRGANFRFQEVRKKFQEVIDLIDKRSKNDCSKT